MKVINVLTKKEIINEMTCIYNYQIIESKYSMEVLNGEELIDVYGVKIERQDFVDNKLINVDTNTIEHISPYRFKIDSLLQALYENTVSPLHLDDLISELVDKYVLNCEELNIECTV